MMRALSVPAGAKMLLGSPSKPMPRERSDALARLVASIDGVLEAHLPQCFAVGIMESPAQVLVVSIDPKLDQQAVLDAIGAGLSEIISTGDHLDVWPVSPGNSMLKSVQGTDCRIFSAGNRPPWWKFW